MGWNEPGGGEKRDPWGNKKNQSPPDIDQLIAKFLKKLGNLFKSPGSSDGKPGSFLPKDYGLNLGIIGVIVVIIWGLSGLFIVHPAEEAVILRLGKFTQIQSPGLHWMARFLDTKYTVDVQKVNAFSIEGEFLTKSSEQSDLPKPVVSLAPNDNQSSTDMTDKSKNLVNVELNVQYRVSDPRAYLFAVQNPDDTIKQVADGALSDVIGKMKLDDVLTTGRELLSSGVFEQLKVILSSYNTGLTVVSVTLRRVQAPDQVRAAFNDVNNADQDRATYIQQAQAYASKVVPLARGLSSRILADATAYQQQAVLNAEAKITRFQALLSAYKSAPELTKERIYLETMQNIYAHSSKVLLDTNSNNLMYLPLDKLNLSSSPTVSNPASSTDDTSTTDNSTESR